MASPLIDYSPELEIFEAEQFESSGEIGLGVLGELDEMELAAELLEVRDEHELDRFFGDLIHKVGRAVGSAARSPIGQALGGLLKDVARRALPVAGGTVGTIGGGPFDTTIGSGLAAMAGKALGLELEGLSHEDREFEAARQFVRFASEAAKNVTAIAPIVRAPTAAHLAAAQSAVAAAARRFAPGLVPRVTATAPSSWSQSSSSGIGRSRDGRWFRQGRNIIVING